MEPITNRYVAQRPEARRNPVDRVPALSVPFGPQARVLNLETREDLGVVGVDQVPVRLQDPHDLLVVPIDSLDVLLR